MAMTAVVALMAVFTGTAHAAPNFESDGYEGNYGERWVGETGGYATGGIETDGVHAYKGSNNGWLFAGGGWAAQARQFVVRDWADRTDCEARFWANPQNSEERMTLQVWNPNGWVLLASGGGNFVPQGQWSQTVSRRFDLSGTDYVYVQAIMGAQHHSPQVIRYDEFELECF
ncbi:hypothetical protein LFM09_25870 [Lentzea alba]|uniref:hypothetical protein n=1 Tax=Lentzea alba TaxID=2714351 RepID=UPI0039BFEE12